MLTEDAGPRTGPYHVRCLRERGLAAGWAAAVDAYHVARWPLWVSGREGATRWRLHGGTGARRFHLWRSDGRLASFPYAAVRHDSPVLTADLAEADSAHGAELLAVMNGAGTATPLALVLDRLGIADRYPLRTGVVRRTATAMVTVRHPFPLGAACRRAALTLTRRG